MPNIKISNEAFLLLCDEAKRLGITVMDLASAIIETELGEEEEGEETEEEEAEEEASED